MVTNKRPITLLNVPYKIDTKTVELKVVLIMMRIILTQQYAYLLGRQIHHMLLILNEMVHRVMQSSKVHLVLKLNIFKAFDCVKWQFVSCVLQHMGFGNQLVDFLQAIIGNANSSIIINGKTTRTFDITRSMRQGDPLSPLFFLLIMQVLDDH